MALFPFDTVNHDRTLWLVYGVECNPQIVCCKIKTHDGQAHIWGFSMYKGVPCFRTMGHHLAGWMNRMGKSQGWDMFEFYADQEAALERLQQLTDPVYQSLIAEKEAA